LTTKSSNKRAVVGPATKAGDAKNRSLSTIPHLNQLGVECLDHDSQSLCLSACCGFDAHIACRTESASFQAHLKIRAHRQTPPDAPQQIASSGKVSDCDLPSHPNADLSHDEVALWMRYSPYMTMGSLSIVRSYCRHKQALF